MSAVNPNPMEKSMVSVLVVANGGGGGAVAMWCKYKCANCAAAGHTDTQHAAYNTRCPIKVNAVREAWQKTRPEAVSLEHIPAETNLIADTTMTADE
jgi:hypothetical protein